MGSGPGSSATCPWSQPILCSPCGTSRQAVHHSAVPTSTLPKCRTAAVRDKTLACLVMSSLAQLLGAAHTHAVQRDTLHWSPLAVLTHPRPKEEYLAACLSPLPAHLLAQQCELVGFVRVKVVDAHGGVPGLYQWTEAGNISFSTNQLMLLGMHLAAAQRRCSSISLQ